MPTSARAPSAPVDRTAIEAVLRPFGRSRMLPAAAYTCPDLLAWERRQLFAGGWTCVGRWDELRCAGEKPGPRGHPPGGDRNGPGSGPGSGGDAPATHRAVYAGDVGVLLTFAGDRPRAFANVCRHRGHELLPAGAGSTRGRVVCPYHGWAYRLDGALAAAAGMRGVAAFDAAAHGLVELAAARWAGWVFVNAAGGAPPFAGYLGALAGLIAPYRPGELAVAARHRYEVAANWKVIIENYHECYHCPLIHPELCQVSPPASGDNWSLPGAWVGGAMDLREHAETMSFDGASRGRFIDGAPRRQVRYVGLFPNLLISAHPDYVMTHLLEPLAPDRTAVECAWLAPPEVADVSYAVEFWDRTNRQDWAACESVQRGLSSPHYRPGPLAAGEDAVYQWVTLVARAYQDPAGALAAACAEPPPTAG